MSSFSHGRITSSHQTSSNPETVIFFEIQVGGRRHLVFSSQVNLARFGRAQASNYRQSEKRQTHNAQIHDGGGHTGFLENVNT